MRLAGIATITAFWLVMMGWLVARDVIPPFEEARETAAGLHNTAVMETLHTAETVFMSVFFGGQRIGETMTSARPAKDGGYVVFSHTRLRTGVAGMHFATGTVYTATVGPDGRLETFHAELRGGGSEPLARVSAKVVGSTLLARLTLGSQVEERQFTIDPELVLFDSVSAGMRIPDLFLGKQWQVRSLDLDALAGGKIAMQSGTAKVVARETIDWNGAPTPCFVMQMTWGGAATKAWADELGNVLKVEAPAGLVLIRESQENSVDADDRNPEPNQELRP